MSNINFKSTFQKAIEDYLLSICDADETIVRTYGEIYERTNCILYSESGIKKLNIEKKTFISVEYFDNLLDFDIDGLFSKYKTDINLIIIVNTPYNTQLKRNKDGIRIIFLDELDNKTLIKPNDRIVESAYRKSKCINIDNFNEYLRFSFRVNLLLNFFYGQVITPNIFGNNIESKSLNDVFPFRYEHGDGVTYIFFEYKSTLKTYFKEYLDNRRDDVVFEQVSFSKFNENEEACFLTISTKPKIVFDERNVKRSNVTRLRIDKINNVNLTDVVDLFTFGGRYEIDDFYPIYKYRQFKKTRYDVSEESVSYNSAPTLYSDSYEICIGSRSDIEKDQVWFSTYINLNDPFDLVVRRPNVLSKTITTTDIEYEAINYDVITNAGLAVFCTTTRNDNILMWAHYGDSNKGMCSTYLQNELLNAISNDAFIGLCLYGRVRYSSDRPQFKITSTMLRYFTYSALETIFNIVNLFSKFIDWKYEAERRFIIFPVSFDKNSFKGMPLTLKAKDHIFGHSFPIKDFSTYLSTVLVPFRTFKLSDDEYKLI